MNKEFLKRFYKSKGYSNEKINDLLLSKELSGTISTQPQLPQPPQPLEQPQSPQPLH